MGVLALPVTGRLFTLGWFVLVVFAPFRDVERSTPKSLGLAFLAPWRFEISERLHRRFRGSLVL